MARPFPDPSTRNPLILPDGSVHEGTVFLKPVIDHPNFHVGDYSYASADAPVQDWVKRLAPYLFPHAPERLVIGKFCQIAHGATFLTASANHRYDGVSSYPFAVFDGGFEEERPSLQPHGPDTIVGHDVWLGREALVLPGAEIGSGVIVGARAVVGGYVPPYSIVAGNPARVVRMRFDAPGVARLLDLAWWDWPISHILTHEAAICGADIATLEAAAP